MNTTNVAFGAVTALSTAYGIASLHDDDMSAQQIAGWTAGAVGFHSLLTAGTSPSFWGSRVMLGADHMANLAGMRAVGVGALAGIAAGTAVGLIANRD